MLVIFVVAWSYASSTPSDKPVAPAVPQKTCGLCTSVDRHERWPSNMLRDELHSQQLVRCHMTHTPMPHLHLAQVAHAYTHVANNLYMCMLVCEGLAMPDYIIIICMCAQYSLVATACCWVVHAIPTANEEAPCTLDLCMN